MMLLFVSVLLPAVGGLTLFALRPKSLRFVHLWTMAFTLAASVCVWLCVLNPEALRIHLLWLTPKLSVSFRLDGLGRLFAGMVAVLWPLSTLYAFEYMKHESHEGAFFGFYMLSYGITLAIAFAEDLTSMYVFYELLSLSTLFLVMHGMKAKSVHAGRKYIYYMLGGAALGFLALTTVLHYSETSNFVFGGIPALRFAPKGLMLAMFVAAFLGFGVKAAVFPFHSWLPTAGVAPTPVTALLHAVAVVKAGAFAVIRTSYYCFTPVLVRGTWAQTVCLVLAMVSIVYGSAMAVREPHLKRRLAYSTMSNLSYVLLGAMFLTTAGLNAGLLHMVFHALMKITLFLCVGAVMIQTGRSYVQETRGLGRRMPFTFGVFLLAGVMLVGIPPFIGFQSKWALALAGVQNGTALGVAAVAALLVSAILTAMYTLTPALSAFFLPLEETGLEDRRYDPGPCIVFALLVLCGLMLVLTFASAPLGAFLTRIATGLI